MGNYQTLQSIFSSIYLYSLLQNDVVKKKDVQKDNRMTAKIRILVFHTKLNFGIL